MTTTTREPRAEKVAVVSEVLERLESTSAAILTEYRGLAVAQMEELRRALVAAGGEYKVYKNTLVRRAVAESSLDIPESYLEGPTGIAFVRDDVSAVAKVLRDFARNNPALVVKGGLVGSSLLDAKSANALAELPSRDVLLAQLAGGLAAPMQRFAGLLAALPQKFAYALSALVDSKGGAPEAPSEALAAADPVQAGESEAESKAEADTPAVAEVADAEAQTPAEPVAATDDGAEGQTPAEPVAEASDGEAGE